MLSLSARCMFKAVFAEKEREQADVRTQYRLGYAA